MKEVWVWAETRRGEIIRIVWELLGKGQSLAQQLKGKLGAILIGNDLEKQALELTLYADKVYLIQHTKLRFYSDVYADLIARLIQKHCPEIMLWGATSLGKELASRVASKVKTGLTAHCIDLYIEEIEGKPKLICIVPGWGGRFALKVICQRKPQMATVKPGILEKAKPMESKGEIIIIATDIKEEDIKVRAIEIAEEKREEKPLEEAEVIVAVGWGIQGIGFGAVEQLAHLLGGVIAGTRPVADKGWIPKERIIGQSGKTVSPRLFISLGASGAMHFTTGFLKSKFIFAIDLNPQAPIFEICDVGIVGDLKEILPLLIEELGKLKSKKGKSSKGSSKGTMSLLQDYSPSPFEGGRG